MLRVLIVFFVIITAGCIFDEVGDNGVVKKITETSLAAIDGEGLWKEDTLAGDGQSLWVEDTRSLSEGEDLPQFCNTPNQTNSFTIAYCEKFTDSIQKDTCISALALVKRDASICEATSTSDYMGTCVGNIAVCKKDESLCDLLNDDKSMKYACLSRVATAKKDISLCESINTPCYRIPCVTEVAKRVGDTSLCDKTEDTNEKDKCVNEVMTANARI